jgi:hypothetical protein
VVLVEGALNISDPVEYTLFRQMVDDFERLPRAKGPLFSMVS